jgi:2-oxoisovalerate dehydrogenase E1 component
MLTTTMPDTSLSLDRAELLRLYQKMLLIRRTEEQLARLHQAGLIPGACHT